MDADIRPSERRFSNPLALAVLVLLYERPMHPYEMATTLRERGKEQSIKLNYGSLYTVIEQLLREKWIGVKEILKEGRRPEKTIYELKPAGETELIDWMRELVSSPVKEYPQFEAALSLLPALPPDEVVALLEIRLGLIEKRFAKYDEESRICREMKLPRLFSLETEYAKGLLEAEYKFSKGLLEDIKHNAGGLTSGWAELRKIALKGRTAAAKKAKNAEAAAPGRRASKLAAKKSRKNNERRKNMSETTAGVPYRPETDPQMMRYWMRRGPKTAAFLLVIPGCAIDRLRNRIAATGPCPGQSSASGAGLLVWGLIVALTP